MRRAIGSWVTQFGAMRRLGALVLATLLIGGLQLGAARGQGAPTGAPTAPPMAPAGAVVAPGATGAPVPWGLGLQPAAGEVKERIHGFNDLVLIIIVLITVFVMVLLGYCMWRYHEARNAQASQTSHNTVLEIAWTVLPVLILVVIAIPSFRLLYYEDRAPNADMTINVQGRQWFWHYEYPDSGFAFDSRPIPTDELQPGQLRNLAVDEPLVVPVGAAVRVLTSGQDVIHSFFVPSLGVQKYTIPGRTLETWFRADRPGTFYGQCNQICGTNHWFMPIMVRAVPPEEFRTWAAAAKTRFAQGGNPAGAPPAVVAGTPPELQIAAAAR